MRKTVIVIAAVLFSLSARAMSVVDWVRQESHSEMSHFEASRIVKTANIMARKNRLDPALVLAVMKKETGFRNNVTSPMGAKGIMQVIPKWHVEKVKGRSLANLGVGTEVGTLVLAEYLKDTRGDVNRALHKYSGGSRYYAKSVLAYRARIILETQDGLLLADGKI